jgi:hypothetical protein
MVVIGTFMALSQQDEVEWLPLQQKQIEKAPA